MNIHYAKTHLSALLKELDGGEKEIILAKAGKPVARIVPFYENLDKRILGYDQGEGWIADDFDAPLPEIEKAIYDSE